MTGERASWRRRLTKINDAAPAHGAVEYLHTIPFGEALQIDCFRLNNGLSVSLVVDKSAPVIAFHAWFRVGSRHEKLGKTGISHLFEHLMFNEVEGLPAGEFDKRMEAAGADNNASTWLDFTQYHEAFPKAHLNMVLDLEARRMHQLVLREPQVDSEKEVVKNERRYRVDDDVEGTIEELLFKTAFESHPYQAPTIGWMADIESFTTEDCRAFYETYYAPNNASLILVGDLDAARTLKLIAKAYGGIPPSDLPEEDTVPEPIQVQERRIEVALPTPTEKLVIGYKGPALGDADHVVASLLLEVLTGGAASRLRKRLVRHDKIASDVGGFVGPHADPSLIEFSFSARDAHTADDLLKIVDEEMENITSSHVTLEELDRARNRTELSLLSGLETADGKASTIGFYQTLLHEPAGAFSRLQRLTTITRGDLLRVARRYLVPSSRTLVLVRRQERSSVDA